MAFILEQTLKSFPMQVTEYENIEEALEKGDTRDVTPAKVVIQSLGGRSAMRKFFPMIALCLLANSTTAANMLSGEWEYRASISFPGVLVPMPEMKVSLCLKAEDTTYGIPYSGAGTKGDCSFKNLEQRDNTTSYDMVCNNSDTRGHFSYTSTPETVEGEAVIKTGDTEITQKWKGQRTGDCDK